MLIYFLAGILRIVSGDVARGMTGLTLNQWMYLTMAVLMLIPIMMVFLTLVLSRPANRWANNIVAGFFILFSTRLACPRTPRSTINSCSWSVWCSTG
jgi:hypothetical protein